MFFCLFYTNDRTEVCLCTFRGLSSLTVESYPFQVQLIYNKNASTPTSPTSPTPPAEPPAGGAAAWTDSKGADKGRTLSPAAPAEAGKDLFSMRP